ncbi:hypothetical protein CROQUDRAFT_652764 [Cronartium quercuum f. sp. fusiforme G11]|uniref:Calponin-homology (CH) domain-containing protein n=1 Tax=Cronartium quercuum f. sp. fusiforme G11 TaxID=708437 RepID=A0A9P6TFM0_9BASI|nr:hypothetical protein CROQUDRAFT_652764 [Cronartium quercuum f. sp. fusiforme G11]
MSQAASKHPHQRMPSPNRKTNKIIFPTPTLSSSSSTLPSSSHPTQEEPANDEFLPPRNTESRMSSRSRRPYYTPQTPRQFSRSAAKRDSVMALGSIAHLQHYFVKNGLASKDMPSQRRNLVLALPGATDLQEEDEEAFNELPEPAPPPPPSKPYFPPGRAVPNLTDLESARQEVMRQLDQVCESWGLIELTARRASSGQSNRSEDPIRGPSPNLTTCKPTDEDFVVSLLALTTRAVRSVQKFISTLPDPDLFLTGAAIGGLERRISSLEVSTSARPRISNPFSSRGSIDPFALFKKRRTTRPNEIDSKEVKEEIPLSVLRRTSLDVLGCLKDIELRFRIPGSGTPFAQADSAPGESVSSPVDENGPELTLPAMSWEYRSDVTLLDVGAEALIVKRWLEAVDGVLEGVTIINGHRRRSLKPRKSYNEGLGVGFPKQRNAFKKLLNSVRPNDVPEISVQEEEQGLGEETEVEEDGELPGWAKVKTDPLKRAHACLVHHLPVDELVHLASPVGPEGSRESFLKSLSDGMLVCVAYNVALRESQRPWGFIPVESIHNLYDLERGSSGEGSRIGLTFRRMENLRVWAAALKLRFLIKPNEEHRFVPTTIARAEDGWEDMLEWMLLSWVEALRVEKVEEVEPGK